MSIRPQGKRSGRENQKTEAERQQIEDLLDVAGLRMEEGAMDHGITSCQQPKQAGNRGSPEPPEGIATGRLLALGFVRPCTELGETSGHM